MCTQPSSVPSLMVGRGGCGLDFHPSSSSFCPAPCFRGMEAGFCFLGGWGDLRGSNYSQPITIFLSISAPGPGRLGPASLPSLNGLLCIQVHKLLLKAAPSPDLPAGHLPGVLSGGTLAHGHERWPCKQTAFSASPRKTRET